MFRYILKRLFVGALTLLVLITATFFLMRAIPGSPFINDDRNISAIALQQLNAKYHLDKPLAEQYFIYLKNAATGDFGESLIRKGQSVAYVIERSAPVTARLGAVAFAVAVVAGIALGIAAALSRRRAVSNFVMLASTIGVSVPSFLLAVLLMLIFGVTLQWLPIVGLKTPWHYILPATALAFQPISMISRLTRTSMMEVMRQDYMILARSKGSSRARVILVHGLRNALLPVVTYAGPLIANLLTGSFVIETLFSVPGIGSEFVTSISNRDYTMVMGLTIFVGFIVIIMNLLSDVAAALVDPRIKLGK